jgi:hypothetical protein
MSVCSHEGSMVLKAGLALIDPAARQR